TAPVTANCDPVGPVGAEAPEIALEEYSLALRSSPPVRAVICKSGAVMTALRTDASTSTSATVTASATLNPSASSTTVLPSATLDTNPMAAASTIALSSAVSVTSTVGAN